MYFRFQMDDTMMKEMITTVIVILPFILSSAMLLERAYAVVCEYIRRKEERIAASNYLLAISLVSPYWATEAVISGRSLLGKERGIYPVAGILIRNESLYTGLLDKVNQYYESYVKISDEQMSQASHVVENIKQCILDYFCTFHPKWNITEMKDTGSCREGLKLINPDEFDVMFSIQLNRNSWQLVPSRNHPNFFEVRKTGQDSSAYDTYISNGSICPRLLRSAFQGKIQKAVNRVIKMPWFRALFIGETPKTAKDKYNISLETHGPAITVKAFYGEGKTVHIDFVPSVEINKIIVVPKPHKVVQEHLPPDMNTGEENRLWRESFSEEEYTFLTHCLPPSFCHLEVLKVFKVIRHNVPSQFGMFSSYVYKTVLMHMIGRKADKTENGRRHLEHYWNPGNLEERLIEFLDTLQGYLSDGRMPHFFNHEINLLEDFSPTSCENLQRYIKHRLGEAQILELLERRGYS